MLFSHTAGFIFPSSSTLYAKIKARLIKELSIYEANVN
ncbi:hypothetical protein QY97_00684 [Bacillus thermotolerans]|nr:hypothetical protein QY97_00684 [Bacillus thermotolerans]KKB44443.1 hypothetical protein QY96_02571 [Bacillus thermotolerans]